METPVVDFVRKYANRNMTRFHMPGHKGHVFFGWEPFDITEIKGADVLHYGNGIIRKSQENAAALFGSGATHYSTEGSTICIKAMLAILKMEHDSLLPEERPCLLAARNVHRSVMDACALLDFDVHFLQAAERRSICSSVVKPEELEKALQSCASMPLGIYITSPDYLGQMADIAGLARVSRKWGVPLLVDNAHGAYLHFLEKKIHPMDLGAAMCCDSAHKTLPALTGAAYLHIHKDYLERFEPYAGQAMTLFGSTSPSYLLMQSLDMCNAYLSGKYPEKLKKLTTRLRDLKDELQCQGICVKDSEALKIVIDTAEGGYDGEEIAEEMREYEIECEYADWQYVVLMATVENEEKDWCRLRKWANSSKLVCEKRASLPVPAIGDFPTEQVLSIREAVFAKSEYVPAAEAANRICAAETIACPPAIPIAVSGERITGEMVQAFLHYGIEKVCVVKS